MPVWVLNNPFLATLDTFMSPSLAVPSLFINILADFMSLCKMSNLCTALRPLSAWMNVVHISCSEKEVDRFLWMFTFSNKSPLSQNSITIHKELSVMNASFYEITYGEWIDAMIRTSFKAFCFSFSFKLLSLTFFKAYIELSPFLLTF